MLAAKASTAKVICAISTLSYFPSMYVCVCVCVCVCTYKSFLNNFKMYTTVQKFGVCQISLFFLRNNTL